MSGSSLISPKSPPSGSLDLYGKRRQMARVQLLEREIASLQDELKSVEGVQAASVCCKELDDFVRANSDPLLLPPYVSLNSRLPFFTFIIRISPVKSWDLPRSILVESIFRTSGTQK
ncbi:hypothetical protein SAY87_005689 [Trapa incisa]|uniref:G protein gamma domain-containing protein n=1 Tax=Trapa incisa TaxID=236973 RepID=A0AAN7K6B0_9MYRT|nr:hypothetical protein SAY87_005689 [Trapa incisa]